MATTERRPKQAVTKRRPRAAERLLNRELSRIDWSARVLEQASDPRQPLLERVKYCAFFSSHMDEFFAVRVAGLLDQAASGLNVRSDDGSTPRATLAEIRKRVEALIERQASLWSQRALPGARRGGDRRRGRRRPDARGARGARGALRAGRLPGADAARRRARPAVPVHLGALAQPRRLRARPGLAARSGSPA